MELLIWIGAALTLCGIAGLFWCIRMVLQLRRRKLPDGEMRVALQRVVALNMGALGVSGIGLMMVVVGVLLS